MSTLPEIHDKIKEHEKIIYLDECAAGVLCFDLFVCGVVISQKELGNLKGVNDSKKLSEIQRAILHDAIVKVALDYEVVRIKPQEVDELNIFQARMTGFKRAIEILHQRTGATYAIIDGNKKPVDLPIETDFLIKADAHLPGVSCASIVAKHQHTQCIKELSKVEPFSKYGLEKHKGYGTKLHMEKLKEHGPIEGFHRYSYKPVQANIKKPE